VTVGAQRAVRVVLGVGVLQTAPGARTERTYWYRGERYTPPVAASSSSPYCCTYRPLLAGFGLGLGSYFVYGAGIVRSVAIAMDVSLQGGPARDTVTLPQEDERMMNRSMSVLVPTIQVSVDANVLPTASTTDASSNSAFLYVRSER